MAPKCASERDSELWLELRELVLLDGCEPNMMELIGLDPGLVECLVALLCGGV